MNTTDTRKILEDNLIMIEAAAEIPLIRERLAEQNEEFCHSFHFTQKMLNRCCYHGFLPMSVTVLGIPLLSLKLHEERVLLPPGAVRAKKEIIKRFGGCRLSVDSNFDRCIAAIGAGHPDSWLSKPLVSLYRKSNGGSGKRVKIHSVELWDGDELIAGELGYTVGSSYTSLTGFHTVNSSGKAQLYGLGCLLARSGFALWDLGMYAPYKIDIGGRLYARDSFLDILHSVRDDAIVFSPETVTLRELFSAKNGIE